MVAGGRTKPLELQNASALQFLVRVQGFRPPPTLVCDQHFSYHIWAQEWRSSLPLELQNALAGGTAPAVTTTPGDYTASSASYAPEVPTSPTSLVDSRTGGAWAWGWGHGVGGLGFWHFGFGVWGGGWALHGPVLDLTISGQT